MIDAQEPPATADVLAPALLDAQFDRHPPRHVGRQHGVAIGLRLGVEKLPTRQAHHAGLDAFGRQLLIGADAQRKLAAGADENHLRLAVGRIGQHVAALAAPAAGAYLPRSSVGRFCRESTRAVGPLVFSSAER